MATEVPRSTDALLRKGERDDHPKGQRPGHPSTRPPDRFEQEVKEKGYLDEADVTESAILRGLRRARRLSETPVTAGRSWSRRGPGRCVKGARLAGGARARACGSPSTGRHRPGA